MCGLTLHLLARGGIVNVEESSWGSGRASLRPKGHMIYKIGDLAREFDVTLRTLRFYEDKGLITPDREGTKRLYSAKDKERLSIALFCKRIGLSLQEIRHVLELHDEGGEGNGAGSQIRQVYAEQLASLERQQQETEVTIRDLQRKLQDLGE